MEEHILPIESFLICNILYLARAAPRMRKLPRRSRSILWFRSLKSEMLQNDRTLGSNSQLQSRLGFNVITNGNLVKTLAVKSAAGGQCHSLSLDQVPFCCKHWKPRLKTKAVTLAFDITNDAIKFSFGVFSHVSTLIKHTRKADITYIPQ